MSKGFRKGAWTKEEDDLLRKCIFEFGEGRWHLVPSRAGVNRCRKSCRLRWLNYLHPNIKRGVFEEDEVDLILKLHRLLGNRWSLIARRLPGRTANDVKNYWNIHLNKKKKKNKNTMDLNNISAKTNVIKPRPWTFSKTRTWVWKNRADGHDIDIHMNNDQELSQTKLESSTNVNVGNYNQQLSLEDRSQLWITRSENGSLSSSTDDWWKSLLFCGEDVVHDLEECISMRTCNIR